MMDEPDERQTKDEELIKQAYVYFRDKTCPAGYLDTRKRVIRMKATKFILQDGKLLYKFKKGQVSKSIVFLA